MVGLLAACGRLDFEREPLGAPDGGAALEAGAGDAAGHDLDAAIDAGRLADAEPPGDADPGVDAGPASNDVRVTMDPGASTGSSVVWTGGAWAVIWSDDRGGGSTDLWFAKLAADGTRLTADVRLTEAPGDSVAPAVAWSGTELGVAWADSRTGSPAIRFARLDGAGRMIGSDVQISNASSSPGAGASLVWNGTGWTVAWHDTRDGNVEIYAAALASDGSRLGADVRVTNAVGLSWWPWLARSGDRLGVAWHDSRDGNYEIYFRQLGPDALPVGAETRVTSDGGISLLPWLTGNGTGFAVVWADDRAGNDEIFFQAIAADSSLIGPNVRVTEAATSSIYPAIAWTGTRYGVVWADDRDGNREIYATILETDGAALGAPRRLTNAPGGAAFPWLAFDGTGFGITWHDERDGNPEIYFARFTP